MEEKADALGPQSGDKDRKGGGDLEGLGVRDGRVRSPG